MKNLLECWDEVVTPWQAQQIILFLDYDGTLSPIAATPSEALLPAENRDLIQKLSKNPFYLLTIISGRRLSELKEMINLENLVYIGNHGWEIEGSFMHFKSLVPLTASSMMKRVKYELITQLSGIDGAYVEDKDVTMSVHYRLVAPEKEFLVKRIFDHISLPYRRKNELKAHAGKKVLELKPPVAWDKGKAALWLLRKQEVLKGRGRVLPVYIGDDNSDEDAFEALKNKGITVFVGNGELSAAEYCLNGTEQVTEFLKHISMESVKTFQ